VCNSSSKIIFKDYNPNQSFLLPPDLTELIEENHPVRTVSEVIDRLNLEGLIRSYKGGGTSSHHPRMLLKILVYGYLTNIFSSRKLEEATKQNVHFMWLAAMSKPDHNTINRFRSERLKDELKQIFTQIVLLLEKEGLVSLQTAFVDGTKIEANANRYTFVWGKAIKKSKERIEKQLEDLWAYTQCVAAEELKDTEPVQFKSIDKEKLTRTIETIDKAVAKKKIPSKIRQKINYAKKNWPASLDKYTEQEKVLEDRNSFSKTDHDATFMRMKEDHMRNGQLKPGYNLQISTNQQFILHYSIHSNPTDTRTLPAHLNGFKEQYNRNPKEIVADAGYGSEENYLLLEKEKITPYVKYNQFDREQKRKKKSQAESTPLYDPELNCYFCEQGKPLLFCSTRTKKNRSGYTQSINIYKAINCSGCPLQASCRVKTFRKNQKLAELYTGVNELLNSERGITLRKRRACDVETVFAEIKNNKGFRRFYLRGKSKVEIEMGLLAIAHNLKKRAA
jgi:transposase